MSIKVDLLGSDRTVLVDERTAELGGSFYIPFEGAPVQPYSPLPVKWLWDRLICYQHATLIDVGASTGSFSLLSKWHEDLKVYAFEPVDYVREILDANIILNELSGKVQVEARAVSYYDGSGMLHSIQERAGSGVSMLDGIPRPDKHVNSRVHPVISLDTYCFDRHIVPTAIKIDTEGNELNILRGAAEIIKLHHPFLILEYEALNTAQYAYEPWELVRLVESMGYLWTNPEGLDLWCVHKRWKDIK